MNTGNGARRRLAVLLSALWLVVGVGVTRSGDRVNQICAIVNDLSHCAPPPPG